MNEALKIVESMHEIDESISIWKIIKKAKIKMKGKSDSEINKFVFDCICAESKSLEEFCESANWFLILAMAAEDCFSNLAQLLYVKAAYYAKDEASIEWIVESIKETYDYLYTDWDGDDGDNEEQIGHPFANRLKLFWEKYNKIIRIPLTDKDVDRTYTTFDLPFYHKDD